MVFANKKLFKNEKGEIHVGINGLDESSECTIEEVKASLKNLKGKVIWRCIVCNDLSISQAPPRVCPTCFQEEVYVQINEKEFKTLLEIQ